MNANLNEIFKLVNPANTIGVNRFLAHALGAAEAAIYSALLAKYAYYDERGSSPDGWFYSTAADLEESTTYSWFKQDRAINKLIEAGLIEYELRGMPARRFFRIGKAEALEKALASGERIVTEKYGADKLRTRENPREHRFDENREASFEETLKQVSEKSQNKFSKNSDVYKTKEKTKGKNQKSESSNADFDDDEIRGRYLFELKKNVRYEELCLERPSEREQIDAMLEAMLGVVCSDKKTLRVNGEDEPQGKIAEAYFKLGKEHLLSALNAVNANPNPVRNSRGYLITVLYNAANKIGGGNSRSAPAPKAAPRDPGKSSVDTDKLRAAVMASYRRATL